MENKTLLKIWCFLDGKPGHEKQSQGLIQGLKSVTSVDVAYIPLRGSLFQRLKQSKVACSKLAKSGSPDLLIATGHATHLALINAKKVHGGKSLVLMRPSFPKAFFDYILVPRHDHPKMHPKVIPTEGALAPTKIAKKAKNKGLILIGGPDKRTIWNNDAVQYQVASICAAQPEIKWTLTTSRRTPKNFLDHFPTFDNLQVVDWQQTPSDWLINSLADSSYCWVSQDSISMLYEALSAQCAVGVIELKRNKRKDKISRNLDRLTSENYLTLYSQWDQSTPLPISQHKLEEHRRCAKIILGKLGRV